VLSEERINISITLLVGKCHLFQTRPKLLSKPYKVELSVSVYLPRGFVGAIGGEAAEISDVNVRDLS
jgi:hypothetical protein